MPDLIWTSQLPAGLPPHLRDLMPARGLLTLRLTARCGAPLHVQPIFEGLALPLQDEATHLGIDTQDTGWVRSVLLTCRGTPLLYARSFISLSTSAQQQAFTQQQHPFSGIQQLGQQPLGLLLARLPGLQRTPFRYAQLPGEHWPHWPAQTPEGSLPARRSRISRQQSHLLLSEVFL